MNINVCRMKQIPAKTETAATAIVQIVGESVIPSERVGISRLSVRAAGTAHTLTVMRKLTESPAIAVAAAAQKVVHVAVEMGAAAGLNAAAANDYIVYEGVDGKWHVDTIGSLSGSAPDISITLTNNIAAGGIALGGRILYLGLASDGHETAAIGASADTTFEADPAYFLANFGEPMVLYDNNATAAGSILGGIAINFNV